MPDLLASFHRQIRLGVGEGSPRSERTWVDGLARVVSTDPQDPWAMVDCPNGLGADPDARIARERDHFVGLGLALEWKTYSYDEPADLGARLLAAGFAKEDDEALMLGELADLVGSLDLPPGVVVRPLRTTGDVRRVRELYHHVWGGSWGAADGGGGREHEEPLPPGDPSECALLAQVLPDGPVVCAARVNLCPGTEFAGMWGGSTHPQWRRRGLFRALLSTRAQWAMDQGYRLARVDASPDSEPILAGLGLRRVATTTPYTFAAAAND